MRSVRPPLRRAAHRVVPGAPGFTLIELMVVVAIIIMAMGLMVPTLLEFFKNQKLKNVRTHFAAAFQVARLNAITEGTPVQVVFFREGVRVYNVRRQAFRAEEEWNPEAAPGSITGITFELRFASLKNEDLPAYRRWEKEQPDLLAQPSSPGAGRCSVKDLVALEFERDGTVRFLRGVNIASNLFDKDVPDDADIICRQDQNPEILYFDIKQTGQVRVKFATPGEERRK